MSSIRRAELRTVDEAVEQGLGLVVDPVEVFDDEEERLRPGLAQEHPLCVVDRALPTGRRVERQPGTVVDGHVEQGQERRQRRLERPIERQQLPGYLLADFAEVVPVLDLEIALEQVDHRQIAGRLAIGHGGALEEPPAGQAMRMDKLVNEARLPDARFADDGRALSVPVTGLLLGASELPQLRVAADEACEAASSAGLQAGPDRACARRLVDLDGIDEALDRNGAERLHLDVAFRRERAWLR